LNNAARTLRQANTARRSGALFFIGATRGRLQRKIKNPQREMENPQREMENPQREMENPQRKTNCPPAECPRSAGQPLRALAASWFNADLSPGAIHHEDTKARSGEEGEVYSSRIEWWDKPTCCLLHGCGLKLNEGLWIGRAHKLSAVIEFGNKCDLFLFAAK
jgi:hypothetical protein